MNRGISFLMALCGSGCAGSAVVMGDVAPDKSPPLTLWAVPKRPCPPDRDAIKMARQSLKNHHDAESISHD